MHRAKLPGYPVRGNVAPMADLVSEIARLLPVEGLARLAADHQDDGHGRCSGCKLPQSGDQKWPCTIYNVSVAALDIRTGRRCAS